MYRVVLIDDERFILSSLEARVNWSDMGFEVVARETSAADGYETICRLEPDVVFTDVKMPGMNGLELMKKVSAIYPKIRFVLLSGYAQFEYVKSAMEYGAEGYCVKPFDEDEIHTLLQKIKKKLDSMQTNVMSDSGAFFAQLMKNTTEGRAECGGFLDKASLSATHTKVLCLVARGIPFEFSHLYSHMYFEAGELDGYVVDTTAPRSVFNNYETEFVAGVSALFLECEQLNDAYEQAKLAYYQRFISGRNLNYFEEAADSVRADAIKSEFEVAVVAQDFLGIKKSFDAIAELLKSGHGDIKTCAQIYETVQLICGNVLDEISKKELYTYLIESYADVFEMLSDLQQSVEKILLGDFAADGEQDTMQKIEAYIHKNYYVADLTLQTLSHEFQFNPNYLSQLFRKHTHQKFTAYLTQIRMEHAKRLLERSDATIGMIAEKVGYMEYFYFAKVFKKYYGMTPSDYRQSLEGNRL